MKIVLLLILSMVASESVFGADIFNFYDCTEPGNPGHWLRYYPSNGKADFFFQRGAAEQAELSVVETNNEITKRAGTGTNGNKISVDLPSDDPAEFTTISVEFEIIFANSLESPNPRKGKLNCEFRGDGYPDF